jgi:hypothetical protein
MVMSRRWVAVLVCVGVPCMVLAMLLTDNGVENAAQVTTLHSPQETEKSRPGPGSSSGLISKDVGCAVSPAAAALSADDEREFENLAHLCTDKTTTHQYQTLYASALAAYRHPPLEVVAEFRRTGKKPYKLLEIGLGCNMDRCVAGGFHLLQAFLPYVEYHAFEYSYELCRRRFNVSQVTPAEVAYLDSHVCVGSSDSKEVVQACGEKFGPFDVVIDDASHLQPHIIAGIHLWMPSPFLKPGGTYVIEDLQTGFWKSYGGGKKVQLAGNTGPELIKDLIDIKLGSNPHSGEKHGESLFLRPKAPERIALAQLIATVTCSTEICAFTKKRAMKPQSEGPKATLSV